MAEVFRAEPGRGPVRRADRAQADAAGARVRAGLRARCSSRRRGSRRGSITRTSSRSTTLTRATTACSSSWSWSTVRTCSRVLGHCAKLDRALPPELAAYIACHVLEALEYAHRATTVDGRPLRVVHRDVSPSNVLLTRRGHVKLADFGIARASSLGRTREIAQGTLKGKFGYMSPEQVRGEALDGRCDVFSMGIVLAEMLMARRLFSAADDVELLLMVRRADLRRLDQYGEDIPIGLDAIVRKALAGDLEQRFASAQEFHDALVDYLESQPAPHRFGAPRRAPARARGRGRPADRVVAGESSAQRPRSRSAARRPRSRGAQPPRPPSSVATSSRRAGAAPRAATVGPIDLPAPRPRAPRAPTAPPEGALTPGSRGRSAVRDRARPPHRRARAPAGRRVQGGVVPPGASGVRRVERPEDRFGEFLVRRGVLVRDQLDARALDPRSILRAHGPGAGLARPARSGRCGAPARRPGRREAGHGVRVGRTARTRCAMASATRGPR